MKERTLINIPAKTPKISYKSGILSLGSCFSVNISNRLAALKYSIAQNPCGITFNPSSLYAAIKRTISSKSLLSSELNHQNGLWSHPDFHSSFNHPDQAIFLENANRALSNSNRFLKTSDFVFMTLGTCFVFRSKKTGRIVNNCHKLPASEFERELLSIEEVTKLIEQSRTMLKEHAENKSIQFVLTVSPVRHTKNGLVDDRRSKSTALLAIHNLIDTYDDCHYFPAYEIMVDDLRDYRYYEDDLIHPRAAAINYIFGKFGETWLQASEEPLRREIENLNKRIAHRPLFPKSVEHHDFVKKLKADIEKIEAEHPHLVGKFSAS